MKIKLITFTFSLLLIISSFLPMYASDSLLDNNNELLIEENISENSLNNTISNPTPTVVHTSSDNILSISDIIDIILIAVCVVLIFLAIAILIRCK